MKKRVTATLLAVVMCLSLICVSAGAAGKNASYNSGTLTVTGLTADKDYGMIAVMSGNTLVALAIGGTADKEGTVTATIPGTLGNGTYTVLVYSSDGTEAVQAGSFTVSSDTPGPGPSPDPSPDPGPNPDPTPTTTPDGGGGGGGGGSGGGGGGGSSSSTSSPKVTKNTGGTVKVSSDGKTVTITPKDGYRVKDVIINGESMGAITKYVFDKASKNNTVQVVFEKISDGSTTDNTTPSFNDVSGHWAADAISFVVERGLFNGTSTNTFSPNAAMTRSMLATVLYRLAGEPATSGASTFPDVPAGQWYSSAVAWAAQNGIVNGTGTGFAPNGNITREQLAAMLYRYCVSMKGNTSVSKALNFPDAGKVSPWASDAMSWAVGAGIINGTDTGALNPGGNATRAEVATMLMRFVNFLG